ncbi:nuclear transport factor 2 family protein [Sneathiella sp.]|uniref:nuclear transport factor 2 family protein n=1 Tax=Sneathiella sp. TaxID=1964365 RepID=UPI0026188080|nr:nuclear transport factor 2 family protein [Sneathiella sp.]MDF2367637.1 nuclear transport factor 2 family protein [Sneathiella sp.]
MTETTIEATLDAYYKALQSGDESQLRDIVSPDIHVQYHDTAGVLPWGGSWRGFDAFRTFLSHVAEHLVIEEVEPLQKLVVDDTVIVVLRGKWLAKATGRRVEAVVSNIFTIKDGRVTGYQVFPDSAAFAMALDRLAVVEAG